MKNSGHQDAATKIDTMGRVQWGKEWCGGEAKEIDDKLDHFALSLDCTPTPSNATTDDTAILDSGCTSNFLSAAAPCSDKQAAHVPLNANMPNGTTIQSSHTCNLLLKDLTPQARQAHILTGLVNNSLISVGQLCDNECSVTFTQDQVTVSKKGKKWCTVPEILNHACGESIWNRDLKQKPYSAIMHMTTIMKKI
jgi:hypothetical protein